MLKSSKIYIAGHNGMVGSAIKRQLEKEGYQNIICRSSKELDLRNQKAVQDFFQEIKPEYVDTLYTQNNYPKLKNLEDL